MSRFRSVVAQRGWLVFGVAFGLLSSLILVLMIAVGGFTAPMIPHGLGFVLVAGVLPGMLLGGAAQAVLRAADRPGLPRRTVNNSGWDRWEPLFAGHLEAFDRVVAGTEEGPVRTWFAQIRDDLHAEIRQAGALIALGRQLEPQAPAAGPDDPQVRAIWTRLQEAERESAHVVAEATRIRAGLAQQGPDLTLIRSQLDVLQAELPRLRPLQ
jgi:hypothetical protein